MPPVTVTAQVVDAGTVTPAGDAGDTVSARSTLGSPTGFAALNQEVLECAPGRSQPRVTDDAETVLFVLEGSGVLHAAGVAHRLEPETGAYLAPGEVYALENPGPEPLRIVAVRVPDPVPADESSAGVRALVRRLADQPAQAATTSREFRIVADPGSGLHSATHFVGYIPIARAPEHFHTYDEVIYVIDGEGVLHAEGAHEPLRPGSCIQLPARRVHCLENTGDVVMRVVAVFRPAGSPAAAYCPDGTPAYAGPPSAEAR
jgi:mannose-6-phosphate isomerase-like protein (cupin superfamily)